MEKAVGPAEGSETMRGLRNLARDLCLIVGSGKMKATCKEHSSGVHVQDRLEQGRLKLGRFPGS